MALNIETVDSKKQYIYINVVLCLSYACVNVNYLGNVLICALNWVVYVCCVPNVVSGFTETVMIILNQWDNRLGDNYKWVNM